MGRHRKRNKPDFNGNEDESSHDNSNVFESTTVREETQRKIRGYLELEEPTLKQLMESIAILIELQLKTDTSIRSMSDSLNAKIGTNSTHIVEIKKQQMELKNEMIQNRGEINILQQCQLSNQMIVSGFPSKPDADIAVNRLCEVLKFNKQLIANYYSYEINLKPSIEDGPRSLTNRKRGFVVLQFLNSYSQREFNNSRKNVGPVIVKQLMEGCVESTENRQLSFRFRFTKVNRTISRELSFLLRGNIIKSSMFRNNRFWVTTLQDEKARPVSTLEGLQEIKKNYDSTIE